MREFYFRTRANVTLEERLHAFNYEQAKAMHDERVEATLGSVRKSADAFSMATEDGEYVDGKPGPVRKTLASRPCDGYEEGDIPPQADVGDDS